MSACFKLVLLLSFNIQFAWSQNGDICGLVGKGGKGTETGEFVDSTFYYAFRNVLISTGAIPPTSISSYNYQIFESNTDQYAITYIYLGRQIIEYNLDSMKSLRRRLRSPYVNSVIAAHEIAHNLYQHFARGLPVHIRELAADTAAGYYIKGMEQGITVEKVLAPILAIASESSVEGYPTRAEREAALREGYRLASVSRHASAMFSIEYYALNYVPNQPRPNSWRKSTREYEVAYKFSDLGGVSLDEVKINNIPSGNFTKSDNRLYFKASSKKVIEIGKIIPSPIPKYRYMIYDDYFRNWFVSEDGYVYNRAELLIGRINL